MIEDLCLLTVRKLYLEHTHTNINIETNSNTYTLLISWKFWLINYPKKYTYRSCQNKTEIESKMREEITGAREDKNLKENQQFILLSVSYTHLDVYKRQL